MDSLNANYPISLKYIDNEYDSKTKSDIAFSGKIIFNSECYIKDPKIYQNFSDQNLNIDENKIKDQESTKKVNKQNNFKNETNEKQKTQKNNIENFQTCNYYKNNYYRYYNYYQKGGKGKPSWWKDKGPYYGGKDNKYRGDWRDNNNCQGWKDQISFFKKEIEKTKKEIERIKALYRVLLNKHNLLKKKFEVILKKLGIEHNFLEDTNTIQKEIIYEDNNVKKSNIENFKTCGYYRNNYNKFYNYYRNGGTGTPPFAPEPKPKLPCQSFRDEHAKLVDLRNYWKRILSYWNKLYTELQRKHDLLKKKYSITIQKINIEINFKKNKLGHLKKNIYDDNNQMDSNYHIENFSNYITSNSVDQLIKYNEELTERQKIQKDKIELIREKEANLQKINALLNTSNDRNNFKKKIILTLVSLIFLLFILGLSTYIYFIRDFKIPKTD